MHRLLPPTLVLALLFATLSVFVRAQGATISIDEIRPGMRGYGLTVFRGTDPERFDVEVIDVLHNFLPDQALILIRTAHPILEQANTVGGMSGSPIYLDGRLAGAYAYGWQFGKHPVAGVTPIANMLAEIDRPLDPELWRVIGAPPLSASAKAQPQLSRGAAFERPTLPFGVTPYLGRERHLAWSALRSQRDAITPTWSHATFGTPEPASTPLLIGGLSPDLVDLLGQELSAFGLHPVQAGGGARPRGTNAPNSSQTPTSYVNGGAIAVQLIRGDISANGVGTVTHVRGQRVIAFGHPMLNAGQVALPTATARVVHILASQMRSFKLSEALQPTGSLVHDRQPAIVVDTTLHASTIPLSIRVHGIQGAPRTTWNVELANHRMLTPMLAAVATTNALKATASDLTDLVFTARSRITLEGRAPIEVVDVGSSRNGLMQAVGRLRLFSVMEAAFSNPFERARVLDLSIDLDVRFGRDTTTIESAAIASDEVDPGQTVNVHVTLRTFDGPPEMRIIPVPIPTSAAGQSLEISIEAGDDVQPELPVPRNLNDVLRAVTSGWPATSLLVSVKLPDGGLRVLGHVVSGLPASMLDSLKLRNASAPQLTQVTQQRHAVPIGRVLHGSAKLKLKVRDVARRDVTSTGAP